MLKYFFRLKTLNLNNYKIVLKNLSHLCKLKLAMDNHNELQKVELLKEIKNAISHEATMFSGYEQHVSEC